MTRNEFIPEVPLDWEDAHIRAEEATDAQEESYLWDHWDEVESIENGYGPLP